MTDPSCFCSPGWEEDLLVGDATLKKWLWEKQKQRCTLFWKTTNEDGLHELK